MSFMKTHNLHLKKAQANDVQNLRENSPVPKLKIQ